MTLLAIDPGPTESAWVVYHHGLPIKFAKEHNEDILQRLRESHDDLLVIEMIASYGMPVGESTFMTCLWVGRFVQMREERRRIWPELGSARLITRVKAKSHICHSAKATDANVRQALIDRYGGAEGKDKAIGKKRNPGPLYGVHGDVWQALAVAITADETGP